MKRASAPALNRRKEPVQARSSTTVDTILEATIHILLKHGLERLTTTKVADRAGVSVGSLYQYFPNKAALVATILKRHLDEVALSVATACSSQHGRSVREMVTATCGAFIDAKTRRLEVSKALYRSGMELGSRQIVLTASARSQKALIAMLRTASDRSFNDLSLPALVLTTAMIGPVQAYIDAGATPAMFDSLKTQLIDMCIGYLDRIAIARMPGRSTPS
jgi:AcrR family transcriptional regulator